MPHLPRVPTPGAYRAAQLNARLRQGSLSARSTKALIKALDQYGKQLERELRRALRGGTRARQLAASQRVIADATKALTDALERSIRTGRSVTFEQTTRIWERAQAQAAAQLGIEAATLGGIRIPPVSMLGAFESLGAPETWRTLLRVHGRNMARSVNAIVREAILQGVSPTELSRRMRLFVKGSEPFQKALDKLTTGPSGRKFLDLRKLSRVERQAAQKMLFNADRIAFTELGNARHEAEIQHFRRDPMVHAVRWRLSADRGSQKKPDECDILARQDSYGMGRGVFPVKRVPPKPHAFDRCELEPVMVRAKNINKPKPEGDWKDSASMIGISGAKALTPVARKAAEKRALAVMRFGNKSPTAARPLRKLAKRAKRAKRVATKSTRAAKVARDQAAIEAASAEFVPAKSMAELGARMAGPEGFADEMVQAVTAADRAFLRSAVKKDGFAEVWGKKLPAKDALHLGNEMMAEWARLRARWPGLPEKPIERYYLRSSSNPWSVAPHKVGDRRTLIVSSGRTTRLQWMVTEAAEKTEGFLWSVVRGYEPRGIFRHEMGHALSTSEVTANMHQALNKVFLRLDDVAQAANPLGGRPFNLAINGKSARLRRAQWIEDNVSRYATKNIDETMAEVFAKVTDTNYVKGTLPVELEEWAEFVLGGAL